MELRRRIPSERSWGSEPPKGLLGATGRLLRTHRCGDDVGVLWRDRIQALTDHATFSVGADAVAVAQAEESLGARFPDALTQLLLESNGVAGEHGLGLVWPLERIVDDNLSFRSSPIFRDLYMPFDPLLFFADAGNGDQFAFVLTPARDDVFVWNHESDSRTWAAGSLDRYLEWWLDGTLRI